MPDTATPPEMATPNPQMAAILEEMRAGQEAALPFAEIPVDAMRARAREQFVFWNERPPAVARVIDLEFRGASGSRRARLYDPAPADADKAALIYFHGGGWVVGDLDLEDTALRHLANDSGAVIVSVDYALAPEHRFPAPIADCVAALEWFHAHAGSYGIAANRIAVGGASAGANLALATALTMRDRGLRWLRFMLLLYGVYSPDHSTESHRRFGGGDFILSTVMMDRFWTLYLEHPTQREDPLASPLRANLAGLPPAFLMVLRLTPCSTTRSRCESECRRRMSRWTAGSTTA